MFDIDFFTEALRITPMLVGKPDRNEVKGFSIDSRTINKELCFVGIRGEKFDGNNFAGEASKKGAQIYILNKTKIKKAARQIKNGYLFGVKDTIESLAKMSKKYKSQIFATILAITGSSGKTTTRELINSILSKKYNVHTAKRNLNTEIGLPMTILEAPVGTHIIILEMGMNHPGEISRLSKIAEPLVGMITNIGYAHIGYLGSRENIADAKSEIFYGINKRGFIFLNKDDDYFEYISKKSPVEVIGFSPGDLSIIKDKGIKGYQIEYKGKKFYFHIPGKYNLCNLAAAFKIGEFYKIDLKDMITAAKTISAVSGRSEIIKKKDYTIINDCYNSNPSSLLSALDFLSKIDGRKIAVISDMLELERLSSELHKMVGDHIVKNRSVDIVFGYGKYTKELIETVQSGGITSYWYESKNDLIEKVKETVVKGDVILVKASRGMRLEAVVESLSET